MALAHSPRIVTDGLVACFDAANIKSYSGSGTTWHDISGQSNNSTLIGGPTHISDDPKSLWFDGINDSCELPDVDTYSSTAKFSLLLFAKPIANNFGRLFVNSPNFGNITLLYFTSSNVPYVRFQTGSTIHVSQQISTANWSAQSFTTFIGISIDKDAGTGYCYMKFGNNNSLLINEIETTFTPASTTTFSKNVLCSDGDDTEYLQANISTVQLYNRALPELDIKQNFTAYRGRYGL